MTTPGPLGAFEWPGRIVAAVRRWRRSSEVRRLDRQVDELLYLAELEQAAWLLYDRELTRQAEGGLDYARSITWNAFDLAIAKRRWLAASQALQDARARYHGDGLPVSRLLAGRRPVVLPLDR